MPVFLLNMKTYADIYEFSNLYSAYLKARKQKRYHKEILEFSYNLEPNLFALQRELRDKTYRVGAYRPFVVYEPKKRQIVALPFRDRIVQHAICNIIWADLDKRMIYDSYACRPGKGMHGAVKRLSGFIANRNNGYFLKLDIKSYFASVNLETLSSILERYVPDPDIMNLLKTIIYSRFDVGIPIGNLCSQFFANIFLNDLDYYAKHVLKVKCYIRYMDDVIIVHSDKKVLREIWSAVEKFVNERLSLTLNRKSHIGRVLDGIEFVGYRVFRGYRLVKKQSLMRMRKKYRAWVGGKKSDEKYFASIGSWQGHCLDTQSHRFVEKIMLDSLFHSMEKTKKLKETLVGRKLMR